MNEETSFLTHQSFYLDGAGFAFVVLRFSGDLSNKLCALFQIPPSQQHQVLLKDDVSTSETSGTGEEVISNIKKCISIDDFGRFLSSHIFNLCTDGKGGCYVFIKCSDAPLGEVNYIERKDGKAIETNQLDRETRETALTISGNFFDKIILTFYKSKSISCLSDFLDSVNYFKLLSIQKCYKNYCARWDACLSEIESSGKADSDIGKVLFELLKNQSKLLHDELTLISEVFNERKISISSDEYHKFETFMVQRSQIINENIAVACATGLLSKEMTWTVNEKNDGLLFRGIVRLSFGETPTLFRNSHDVLREDRICHDFLSAFPNQFLNQSKINILATMQHHGLPTRLLDLTSNPLTALYMACTDQFSTNSKNDDGEVLVYFPDAFSFDANLLFPDDPRVNALSSLSLLTSQEKSFLTMFLLQCKEHLSGRFLYEKLLMTKEYKSEYEEYACRAFTKLIRIAFPTLCDAGLYLFDPYSLLQTFYVLPEQINDRIRAQSGAFLLIGLQTRDSFKTIVSSRTNDNGLFRLIITNKKNILQELSDININRSTLFPDMDNVAGFLKDQQK